MYTSNNNKGVDMKQNKSVIIVVLVLIIISIVMLKTVESYKYKFFCDVTNSQHTQDGHKIVNLECID